jgi:hypothetical protein
LVVESFIEVVETWSGYIEAGGCTNNPDRHKESCKAIEQLVKGRIKETTVKASNERVNETGKKDGQGSTWKEGKRKNGKSERRQASVVPFVLVTIISQKKVNLVMTKGKGKKRKQRKEVDGEKGRVKRSSNGTEYAGGESKKRSGKARPGHARRDQGSAGSRGHWVSDLTITGLAKVVNPCCIDFWEMHCLWLASLLLPGRWLPRSRVRDRACDRPPTATT